MNHVYQLLIPIIIPRIADEYQLSTLTAGILISVFSLSYALLQIFSGFLSRLMGRKNMIIVGIVITSISFFILGFVDNILLFAFVLFVAGMGGSTYHPNGMPLLSEFYKENRGQAAGFHQAGGSLGSIIAPLVIGPLVFFMNWRLTVTVLSFPGLVLSAILWLLVVEPERQIAKKPELTVGESKRTSLKMYSSSLVFIAASVIYVLGLRGVDSFAVLYFQRGRGIENFVEATFIFSTFKMAGLFSGPLCGKLSDIFGRKKAISVLVCIEAVSIYALTVVPNSILVIPCIVFGFASFGLLAVTDAFLADLTPEEYMSTVYGLHFTMSFLTQVIIPPVFGIIVDYSKSFDTGFIVLSAIIPLSLPILLKVQVKPAAANDD